MQVHSTPVISDDSTHHDGEQMRRSLGAQFAFFIRHPSPLLIGILILATFCVRLSLGGFGLVDLALAIGIAAYWPAQEWFLHKYFLHLKPRTIFGMKFDPHYARAHRAHHRQPWIVEYTFLPAKVVIALVPISIFAWVAITPTLPLAFTGIVAYGIMALLYEWTHYLTHSAYVPRSAYYRRIWKNHRLHHFKNEQFWYAFTVPAVDTFMKTDPDQASVEKSESVRTLGVEE